MRWVKRIGGFIAWLATIIGTVIAAVSYADSRAEKNVDKVFAEFLLKLSPEDRKLFEGTINAARDLSKSAIGGSDKSETRLTEADLEGAIKKLAPLPTMKGVGRYELLPEKPVQVCDGTDILTYKEGREGAALVSVNSGPQRLEIGQKVRFSLQKRGTVLLTLISKGKGTIDLMVECETG